MPRERALCVADNEQDALVQLAAAMATGCEVLWPEDGLHRDLAKQLPKAVSARIHFAKPDACLRSRLTRLSTTVIPISCANCASRLRPAAGDCFGAGLRPR